METQITEPMLDEFQSEEYDERLYRFDNVASGIDSLDNVKSDHIAYYKENGFLAVQKAYSKTDIQAALSGFMDLINGKIPGFNGIQFEKISAHNRHTAVSTQKQDSVRKLKEFVEYEPRLKMLAEQPKLLSVVSRLIGAEPELFQNQALSKPPGIGREKPWHQDHSFFNLPIGTPIVGCWIALDKAIPQNGCMHVKPGTHKEGPKLHFKKRDWQICDNHLDLNRDVMVPLNPGGLLFFDGLIHHGTPANRTSLRRRALQFHYIPKGTPRVTDEERMAVFGSEGKNVTC
jgi:phytanoyl-CoA hydroxylase